jgi:hypothetical protein
VPDTLRITARMSLSSGSLPSVKVMQPTHLRDFEHMAKGRRLDQSADRRIFFERQMRAATFVIGKIALQSSAQGSGSTR